MGQGSLSSVAVCRVLLAAAMLSGTVASAQNKAPVVPDAQVDANVLRALAGNTQLADQSIRSTTVYGTVTLSGTVRDEASRTLAETLVSKTSGVQKVVDELTLATDPPQSGNAQAGASPDPNVAPDSQANTATGPAGQPGYGPNGPGHGQPGYGQNDPQPPYGPPPSSQQQRGDDPRAYGQPDGSQPPMGQANGAPYGDPGGGPYGSYGSPGSARQPYPAQGPYGAPPPLNRYPQQGNNGQYSSQGGYGPQGDGQQGYGGYGDPNRAGSQQGGVPVTVPSGTVLRVRISQGLNSGRTDVGTTFDAVVVSDVMAGGLIAIPRGAMVQGSVVSAEASGALKGRGELVLQLNRLMLGGTSYPLVSDTWSQHGRDKTTQTVNSAIGLGAVGAVIGAVAGGGAGAAIGAGAGGVAGIGASAASGRGQAMVPPEAVLSFHLQQPAQVVSVSQDEMNRLGYGVPAGVQQVRYARPGPYPYYGGVYPYVYGSYPYVYGPRFFPYGGVRVYRPPSGYGRYRRY